MPIGIEVFPCHLPPANLMIVGPSISGRLPASLCYLMTKAQRHRCAPECVRGLLPGGGAVGRVEANRAPLTRAALRDGVQGVIREDRRRVHEAVYLAPLYCADFSEHQHCLEDPMSACAENIFGSATINGYKVFPPDCWRCAAQSRLARSLDGHTNARCFTV